jgi:hypothetical protein
MPDLKTIECDNCGGRGFSVQWRLVAKEIGDFSLAGAQMKFSAVETPFLVCDHGCGRESRGRR